MFRLKGTGKAELLPVKIPSFKLQVIQKLHIALSFTYHWPHLATREAGKYSRCPHTNPMKEEKCFAGQLSFSATAFLPLCSSSTRSLACSSSSCKPLPSTKLGLGWGKARQCRQTCW